MTAPIKKKSLRGEEPLSTVAGQDHQASLHISPHFVSSRQYGALLVPPLLTSKSITQKTDSIIDSQKLVQGFVILVLSVCLMYALKP